MTFTLTIRWPNIRVGGAFITTGGVGTLKALPGEGLAERSQGLTHTTPKTAANGAVTFRFSWQAPTQPGAVDVGVAALAGNGNNASSGDSPGGGEFQWVFGCSAGSFYLDSDRDGYGARDFGIRLGCAGDPAPAGYAKTDGDCNENDETVHPGAVEVCNAKDDNCDGQIDENAPAVMMWPDSDGDGYYQFQTGTPKLGCGNLRGYAVRGGDCNDTDPAVHPDAAEICNARDDNCNGEADERVRPQCGVGWCARYSPTCDPADCRPGPPAVETCNLFDDDCDGVDDNGACPAGMSCFASTCVSNDGGSGATGGAAGSVANPAGSGGGSGAGGAPRARDNEPSGRGCAVAVSTSDPPPNGTGARQSWSTLALAGCLGMALLRRTRRREFSPGSGRGRVKA